MKINDSINHFEIKVSGRERPLADDYWDGNWLKTQLYLSHNDEILSKYVTLRVAELLELRDSLNNLVLNITNSTNFQNMEQDFIFNLNRIKDGTFTLKLELKVDLEMIIIKEFSINLTILTNFITELNTCLAQYPLVGEVPN